MVIIRINVYFTLPILAICFGSLNWSNVEYTLILIITINWGVLEYIFSNLYTYITIIVEFIVKCSAHKNCRFCFLLVRTGYSVTAVSLMAYVQKNSISSYGLPSSSPV